MLDIHWNVKAVRACTGQGKTPAQIFAGVATFNSNIQFSEALTYNFDGALVKSSVCPVNSSGLEPSVNRAVELAADSLIELYEQSVHWPDKAVIALQIGYANTTEHFCQQLNNELARQGQLTLAQWCEQATVLPISQITDWEALSSYKECLWLSADCLINTASLSPIELHVANDLMPEGLVLGEAAAAIWLSRKSEDVSCPALYIHSNEIPKLSKDASPLDKVSPFEDLIINTVSSQTKQQSAWYQWLAPYANDETLEIEQHYWLARSVGHLGAASAGVGVTCALGGLNLPLPSSKTAWLIDQTANQQYAIYQLMQGEHNVR